MHPEPQRNFLAPVLIGSLLAVLLLVGVFAFLLLAPRGVGYVAPGEDPEEMLIVCVAHDADGSRGAGFIAILSGEGDLEAIDPGMAVALESVSHNTLWDAYAFGGGELVAKSVAENSGRDVLPWVLLPVHTWLGIVEDGGGVLLDVPESRSAYLDGQFYYIVAGAQEMSGEDLHVLLAAERYSAQDDGLEAVQLTGVLMATLTSNWSAVVEAVEDGDAESSVTAEQLRALELD